MQNTMSHVSVDQITVTKFLNGFEFRDQVTVKLNDLWLSNSYHRSLEKNVRVLLDMIEESRLGRYTTMPLVMFAHAVVELGLFVQIHDGRSDTRIDGYDDDARRIQALCDEYRSEVEMFLSWRKRYPEDYMRRTPARMDLSLYD